MKTCIILAVCLALAAAAPPSSNEKEATILRYDNDNIGVNGYNFAVETSDGKAVQEQAQLKNVGSENEALEVRGQYSYTAPDGVVYSVTYVANELGFQPQGAHLPKPL